MALRKEEIATRAHEYWLLRLNTTATVTTDLGPQKARLHGECILVVDGDAGSRRAVSAARFTVAVGSTFGSQRETGVVTVVGCCSTGLLTEQRNRAQMRCDVEAQINDEHIDAVKVPDRGKGCYYRPAFEPCAAHIMGELEPASKRGWRFRKGELRIVCAAGDIGQVRLIEMPLDRLILTRIPALAGVTVSGPAADSNSPYDPCVASMRRTITVQPVGFRTGPMDPSPSASTAAAQLATAQAVWNKGCIDINIRPTVFIDNATLKTSSDQTAIRAAYTDADPAVIEIFFVQNALTGSGGGNSGAIGVASCKAVIAEPNGGNPVLVSHELGHVLNLLHPGAGSNSDPGTVMQPTGSAMNPGTNLVTHNMCISIANPVLGTTTTACCFSHDKGDHFIRDFPTDPGNEPSDPLPVGMTRYSMSNVWNRLTATAGGFSTSTGPAHESPYRFNADLTPKTNFLFATVEQRQALAVRNAAVRFYLKNPGSGGGGAALTFLGQVAVPATLALGSPQTVQLAWTVPGGAPNHSCVFGVVTSPAEPEGNQTGLNWAQFEDLAHQDNDWAQRNLDILNVSSSNDDSNVIEAAPWVIALPEGRPLPFRLDVDARASAGLAGLTLEIPGVGEWTVTPGKTLTVRPKLRPRSKHVVVLLHARLPKRARLGDRFSVFVDPRLGRVPLVGFGTAFAVTSRRAMVEQLLDRLLAAFVDLAVAVDSEAACGLERQARRVFLERPCSLGTLLEVAAPLVDRSRWGDTVALLPGEFGVAEALQRMMSTWCEPGAPAAAMLTAVEAMRSLAQRLQLAASTVGTFPAYAAIAPAGQGPSFAYDCQCRA